MTTPPLTHTVEGLMALVKSFGDITLLHAMGRASSSERQKAWDDVRSYAVWLVDATAVDAAAEALKTSSATPPDMREALRDMLAGWQYIRSMHGDLYGVGWDRAEAKAIAALADPSEPGAKP